MQSGQRSRKNKPGKEPNAPALDGRTGNSAHILRLFGVVTIALAATIGYLPSIHGGFIMDDDVYLIQNDIIKSHDGLYRFWFTTEAIDYYPLSNSTLWLEWRLWEMNPTGYHVTNLLLHITSAIVLWSV